MPYPCCRLLWKGKEPSWNRIGRRFVPDIAAKKCPSYAVQFAMFPGQQKILTLYYKPLTKEAAEWWVTPSSKLKHYWSSENAN